MPSHHRLNLFVYYAQNDSPTNGSRLSSYFNVEQTTLNLLVSELISCQRFDYTRNRQLLDCDQVPLLTVMEQTLKHLETDQQTSL